jgi:hypothetical protein
MKGVSTDFERTFSITRDNCVSYSEAAIVFGVSIETVKSRVKTVLKIIKPCLESYRRVDDVLSLEYSSAIHASHASLSATGLFKEMFKQGTELQCLEFLYRETIPKPVHDMPDQINQGILARGKERIAADQAPEKTVSLHKSQKSKALWSIFSLATGLLAGVLLANYIPSELKETSRYEDQGPDLADDKTLPQDIRNLDKSGPGAWQRRIADYVLLGEMKKAERLLDVFDERFPEYGESTTTQK